MAIVHFVRHGEAAATFAQHTDPGLSDLGRAQAMRTATALRPIGPLPIFTSPLRRTQETAQALADIWSVTRIVDSRFAEVPSPQDFSLEDRSTWLRKIMAGRWQDLPEDLREWRQTMIDAALEMKEDCVVFSHYVAINILVGAADGLDPLISFAPNNASVTVFDNAGGTLKVLSRGEEASTTVN